MKWNKTLTLSFTVGISSLLPLIAQKGPPIILIMTDQQRFDALGCMGNKTVISPNIDALSHEGTTFMNGYSSCPSSTPARAGLLTGFAPWHHGLLGYGKVAPTYKYEMPRMLREQGYYTFGIGKMHWHPQRARHGFHGTLLDESGRVEDPNFMSDYRLWFQLQDPSGNPDATGLSWNGHGANVYQLNDSLHPTYWTGEMACEMIRNYSNTEQPLFLKVSFARPHSPYDPPRHFLDMYADKAIPGPYIGDWCQEWAKPLDPQKTWADAPYGNFGEEYVRNSKRHYYANVSFIDKEIGDIIQTLKKKGMYDEALIVFVSDHGDMLGDHYHWRKTYPYEGSTHIPYIVKWPKSYHIQPGEVEQPVELRDVLPTFLEASGREIPQDMDGKSLIGLARGKSDGWRKYIDLEHATSYSDDNYWCGLTDGKIKYIWSFHTGKEQLFDLKKDSHEIHDVANDKKYKKILEIMRREMIAHLSERGEGFVKDGQLVVRKSTLLYGPDYPKK